MVKLTTSDKLYWLNGWCRLTLGAGSVLVLIGANAGPWLEPVSRAVVLSLGFMALSVAVIGSGRQMVVPLATGLVLFFFCGLSALTATPQTPDQVTAVLTFVEGFQVATTTVGFRDAAFIMGLGGLVLFWTVLSLTLAFDPKVERSMRSPQTLVRIGRILVLAGFLGLIVALVRFTVIQAEDPFSRVKTFWSGGSGLLIIATFAVPGFALWVQGLIGRKAKLKAYMPLVVLTILWLVLSAPAGQRVFLVGLGLMLAVLILGNGFVRPRYVVLMILVGVFLVGMTQAARNELREEGGVSLGGFVQRASPDNLPDLFRSQMAEFDRAAVVVQNRDRLEIPNSYVAVLEKPIPRGLLPEKSQGFGAEFTSQVFSSVADQDVYFAVPFFSEAEFNFGLGGLFLVSVVLGVVLWGANRFVALRAPPLVEPIVLATIFWFLFVMIRGDLANALVFSGAWIIPLVVFSRALGLRNRPAPKRVVVDATQVPAKFSGIGRRVMDIGDSLCGSQPDLPIEVLCCEDTYGLLADSFPEGTLFRTPHTSSRPRLRRIIYQQLIIPMRYRAKSVLVCPGDQAPIWGTSPVILVIHDTRRLDVPETASSRSEVIFYRWVMSIGAHRAAAIITISHFTASRIECLFRPECPVEIVTTLSEKWEPVTESELSEAPPSFLVLGAIRPYKGTNTVVRAINMVANGKSQVDLRVHFVGEIEGNRLPKIESVPDDKVTFEGWLSDSQLRRLARKSAGTINASEYEGYGLPVAESLAMGLPTLASDIPPHREIGSDAVKYFPVGDSSALAGLLREVAEDTNVRIEMALRARLRTKELRATQSSWAEALWRSVAVAGRP